MPLPTVLLTNTTWWPCASRIALAFSRSGCEVAAVYPSVGHPLQKTSVVGQRFKYSPLHPVDSLKAAIDATNPQIVIPCDDRAVQHLHELHARSSAMGASGEATRFRIEQSLGTPISYTTLLNRYQLLEVAREEGLRVPETSMITSVQDLRSWSQGQPLPWVMKTDGSWGGHGVRIVCTFEEAEDSLARMACRLSAFRAYKRLVVNRDPFWLRSWRERSTPNVTVQSYIQGHPANCSVACWNGDVLAGIAVEVVAAQGVTGCATIVRVIDGGEMLHAARRLVARLNLSGFVGLDFVIEETTAFPVLIEMNPRSTPLCHLRLGSGRDLIEALAARLSSRPFRRSPPVTENDLVAYFPQAWHWDGESELFKSSYHDIPLEEPALVEELLRVPWPDRSLIARISDYLRRITPADRSKGGTFVLKEKPGLRALNQGNES